MRTPRLPTLLAVGVVLLATGACGDDGPPGTWDAVDDGLCAALAVQDRVDAAYPALTGGPVRARASEDDANTSATCETTLVDDRSGREVRIAVQVSSFHDGDPGAAYERALDLDFDNYAPGTGAEPVERDLDGWWQRGEHRELAWEAGGTGGYVAVDAVRHDNLVAQVLVADQGQTVADRVDAADVARDLAGQLLDGVEDVVPERG